MKRGLAFIFFVVGVVVLRADYLPLTNLPDVVTADFGTRQVRLDGAAGSFSAEGAVVRMNADREGAVRVAVSSESPLVSVTLSWSVRINEAAVVLGDHWERTYGETYWRPIAVRRAMPWFFLLREGSRTDGYGVKVQPNAFACWRIEKDRLNLVIDVRAAGRPVHLNGRTLEAVTLVSRRGVDGESAFAAGTAFCKMMCPNPRLPREPVYGYNDWYCAYGKQTAEGFLRDAREVVSLCADLPNRPYAVVDDGWQRRGGDKEDYGWGAWAWTKSGPQFGMEMSEFARSVAALGAKPGLWYRPLIAWPGAGTNELQLANEKSFDPTVPSVRARIAADIQRFRSWGMKLVKIDFLTYDLTGNWVCARKDDADRLIIDERGWRDETRTTVEVMKDLYAAMREAAGDDMVIIGCNAINHLAAGLFEVQRTGDDTSGRRWEPTFRNGVNTLGMRAMMNRTFYHADPDCVGLAWKDAVPWRLNAQWLDLVSRSGMSLFVSWKHELMDEDVRRALRKAFARASRWQPTGEPLDWIENRCPCHWRFPEGDVSYLWQEKKLAPSAYSGGSGSLRFGTPFADHMVLQRDRPVRIWGWGADFENRPTIEFSGSSVVATVDSVGRWSATLPPMSASKEGRTLTLRAGGTCIELRDVLVGEVWLCSGQSNASCNFWGPDPRFRDGQGATVAQTLNKPFVRTVKVRFGWDVRPNAEADRAEWVPMTAQEMWLGPASRTVRSAMGVYFALELANSLDIPIGLVDASMGGTNIDSWTPRSGLLTRQDLKDVLDFPLADHRSWTNSMARGVINGPHQQPTVLFNRMVAPYAPMSLRGVIWYQGCHNQAEWRRYASKMHALYNGWAMEFDNPDLRFYFAQLAPWGPCIAPMQEAQAQFADEEPNAAIVVLSDVGNLNDIHPNDKRTVARRLALHALKKDYGFTWVVDESPTVKDVRRENDTLVLTFNHASKLYLYNPDRSKSNGFEIAGSDGVFHKAEITNFVPDNPRNDTTLGRIDGEKVVLRATGVLKPEKVRYLYSPPYFGSLYNEVALPLGAFHYPKD